MKELIKIFLLGLVFAVFGCAEDSDSLSLNPSGQGGSMARFAISSDHLYIVNTNKLIPFGLDDPMNPQKENEIFLGQSIETVYPYQHYLFIGSEVGMHVYDIANPSSPQWISTYQHVRACDPVVVQGHYAYVTLRTEVECIGTLNVLEVINIADLRYPFLEKQIDMANPHGLGIDGEDLFVCNGAHGFVSFDAAHPVNLELKKEYPDHDAYDVILRNGLMIVTGKDGIYQYDYSEADTLKYLSKINIKPNAL